MVAILLTTGCARLAPGPTNVAAQPARVYLVRGFLDWYSTGIDRLTDELRSAGVPAIDYREEQWGDLEEGLLKRPAGAGPTVLIGFSYGADDVIEIARGMGEHGRAVDLLIAIDPVTPMSVPANVRRCVSFYEPNGVWDVFPWLRGVPLHAEQGERDPENVNVRERADLVEPGTSHATIAGNEHVHRAIIDLVREACRNPGLRGTSDAGLVLHFATARDVGT